MEDQIKASPAAGRVQENIDLLSSSSIPKTRAMEILTSPGIMADFFRTRLSGIFPEELILKECKPQVLKDRQESRQVVSYRLIFSHRSVRKTMSMILVVKRFADRTRGMKEYLIMRMLWEKGFDHKSSLKIPKPFSFLEDLSLLIQERAHGLLLRKNLSHNSPVALAGMKAAARWLIKLHQVDADYEGISLYPDDETSIRGWVCRIGSKDPKLLSKLEELGSLIRMKQSSFKNPRFTLVHGDFQCENIFVDREKVTMIDFGRFCKSDPARDLGCMIAQARTIGFLETASFVSVLPGLNAFWKEYLTAASVEERETLSARTCTFAAIKHLENIDYISAFSSGEGKDVCHFLLSDAERFGKADRVEELL